MTIVIAGAGLAGLRTAQEVRKLGYDGEVVLVGDENHLPYDRPPLSKEVIRGERDDTTFETEDYFTEHKIDLRLGSPVASVDPAARRLKLADGTALDYDHLVVATGLRPRKLASLPDLAGVHVLRSRDDAEALRRDAASASKSVPASSAASSRPACGISVSTSSWSNRRQLRWRRYSGPRWVR